MLQPLIIPAALCWTLFCLPTFLLSWGPKEDTAFPVQLYKCWAEGMNYSPSGYILGGTRAKAAPWLISISATPHDRLFIQLVVHHYPFPQSCSPVSPSPALVYGVFFPVPRAGLCTCICQLRRLLPAYCASSSRWMADPHASINRSHQLFLPVVNKLTKGLSCHIHIIK